MVVDTVGLYARIGWTFSAPLQYTDKLQSGLMEALAPLMRKKPVMAQELKLAEYADTLREVCGVQSLTIDWGTVGNREFDNTGLVEDSESTIFSSDKGELRLVENKNTKKRKADLR